VPIYGKFAGFGDFIFNYDAYVLGGLGLIRTQPIAIIDPDNRKFTDWNNNLNFDVGLGFRIFFTRWLAATIEVRDLIYLEETEALTINQADPTNSKYWTNPNNQLTNDVQLQLGISLFLPTSFEYKLPK
jgi:outer membrane beta-barrel protein